MCGIALTAECIFFVSDQHGLYPLLEATNNDDIYAAAWIGMFVGFCLFCLSLGNPWYYLVCTHITSVSTSVFIYLCFSSSVFPYYRTLVIGSVVHLNNLGWSHLEIRNLVTSAKTFLPYKFTFTGSLWTCLLAGFHSTHYMPLAMKSHWHMLCRGLTKNLYFPEWGVD